MKKILLKIKMLSLKQKIKIGVVIMLTVALMIFIPVYAWFAGQRKAAEMYKIQFPNSLYVNAAHREDQIYFNLDAVNVNELEKDSDGNVVYYTDSTYTTPKTKDVDGVTVYDTTGETRVIRSQKYVFSVFGTNTEKIKIQIAYTNNNQFKYKLYNASEETTKPASYDVDFVTHENAHTTSWEVFSDDLNIPADIPLYYVQSNTAINGHYLNTQSGDLLAKNNDTYYTHNYGTNTNVEERSVPIYWQSESIDVISSGNNKQFTNYFILEVTWDASRNAERKETDMIAITAKRVDY